MISSLNDKYEEPAVAIKLMYLDDGVMVEEYSFDGLELWDAWEKTQKVGKFAEFVENNIV